MDINSGSEFLFTVCSTNTHFWRQNITGGGKNDETWELNLSKADQSPRLLACALIWGASYNNIRMPTICVYPLGVHFLMCYLIKYSQPWRNVIPNSFRSETRAREVTRLSQGLRCVLCEVKGLAAGMIWSLWKESMSSLLEGVPWKQKILIQTLILSNNKQNLLNIFHVC